MLLITTIASPILLILFVNAEGWLVFPLLIILGFLAFSSSPVMMALALDNKEVSTTSINSIYMTLNFVIGSFVVLLFGFLGDIIQLENVYYVAAGLTISGLVFVMMLKE